MTKRILPYLLLLLVVFNYSCSKDNNDGPGGGGGGGNTGEVSQYEAREWDGVKRAEVFYEIFVRSFADSDGDGIGDLRGIINKLDYLDQLGIGGIWLTPIHPSPSYHGYDVEDYTAINPEYGTMADFDELISKAHAKGIKVILDMVLNHTSKTHPWFEQACSSVDNEYRDWFLFAPTNDISQWIKDGKVPMTNEYHSYQWHTVPSPGTIAYSYFGWFSDWMPELNYGPIENARETASFKAMCEASKFWLDKGVDGFRLDAVKHIYQSETSSENPTFLKYYYQELEKTKPGMYMVGECWMSYEQMAKYFDGCPALFDFECWERLKYAVNNHHAKWYPKDMLQYQSEYGKYRSDYIQATKLTNHDESRARTELGGDINKAKIAGAILLTASGNPYIYYGEELGMLGNKHESGGDKNVREPFLWDAAAKDTHRTKWTTGKYSNDYTVSPLEKQKSDYKSIYRLYEKFMELRNTYPALAYGTMSLPENFNDSSDADKNFMVFYREYGSEKLLVIHNVSDKSGVYTVNHAVNKAIADQGNVKYEKGNGDIYRVTMPAYSSIIFEL